MPKTQDPAEQLQEEQERGEKRLIRLMKVNSFTAEPQTVTPFGRATLRWDVSVPVSTDPDIQVGVKLGEDIVPAVGSRVVAPVFPTVFLLKGAGEFASRELSRLTVNTDLSRCVIREAPVDLVAQLATAEIVKIFESATGFTLKEDQVAVTLDSAGVNVGLPIKFSVPNWFDADVQVALKFGLRAVDRAPSLNTDMRVHAELLSASIDVSWHFLEHLLSLGCTGAVQAALEKQADAFITGFIGPLLADPLQQGMQAFVDGAVAQASSTSQRPMAFHSLTITDVAILVRICPK